MTDIRLDYCDLSSLGLAWRPGIEAAADPLSGGRGGDAGGPGDADGPSVVGGAALAFTGRSHGSALCIDFAEVVDTGR